MSKAFPIFLLILMNVQLLAQVPEVLRLQPAHATGNCTSFNRYESKIVDAQGNIYFQSFVFSGCPAVFGNFVITDYLSGMGGRVIGKMDCNGNYLWVRAVHRLHTFIVNDKNEVLVIQYAMPYGPPGLDTVLLVDSVLYPKNHPKNPDNKTYFLVLQKLDATTGLVKPYFRVLVHENEKPCFYGFLHPTDSTFKTAKCFFFPDVILGDPNSTVVHYGDTFRGPYAVKLATFDTDTLAYLGHTTLEFGDGNYEPHVGQSSYLEFLSNDKRFNFVFGNVSLPAKIQLGDSTLPFYDTTKNYHGSVVLDSNGKAMHDLTYYIETDKINNSNFFYQSVYFFNSYSVNRSTYLTLSKSILDTVHFSKSLKSNTTVPPWSTGELRTFMAKYNHDTKKFDWVQPYGFDGAAHIRNSTLDNQGIWWNQLQARGFILNANDTVTSQHPDSLLYHKLLFAGIDTSTGNFVKRSEVFYTTTPFGGGHIVMNLKRFNPDRYNNLIIEGEVLGGISTKNFSIPASPDRKIFYGILSPTSTSSCNCIQAPPTVDIVQSSNSGITFNVSGIGDSIVVIWGDGTKSSYAGGSALAAQHQFSTPGVYTICIQLYGLCGITSVCVKNYPLSIDHLDKDDYQIYPNPAYDIVWIDKPNEEQVSYELYNSIGLRLQSGTLSGKKSSLSLSRLPMGVYQLRLVGKNNYLMYQILKNE